MFLQLCIHLAGLVNFSYGIYFELLVVDIPASVAPTRNLFGGPWKYLTFLNLWIQLAFNLIGLTNALFGTFSSTKGGSSKIQRYRDFLFASLAFPIGMFVGLMFWTLFFINRDLIFSAILDKYIPPFQNHVLHTSVIILQVLELCCSYHVYPRLKSGISTTILFSFAYLTWLMVVAYFGGFWVYPIFKVLSPPMRLVFITVASILGGFLYIIGDKLNNAIWAKHIKRDHKKRLN